MDHHIVVSTVDVKKVFYILFAFGMCVMYLWLTKFYFWEIIDGLEECRNGSYGSDCFSAGNSDHP